MFERFRAALVPLLHGLAHFEPLDARFGREAGAGRQRLPGEDGMDGFFYAVLVKDSADPAHA